jgi:hypothetical protein
LAAKLTTTMLSWLPPLRPGQALNGKFARSGMTAPPARHAGLISLRTIPGANVIGGMR